MSNATIIELRTLEDEELLDIVGGGGNSCEPQRCSPCHDDLDVDVSIKICVAVSL